MSTRRRHTRTRYLALAIAATALAACSRPPAAPEASAAQTEVARLQRATSLLEQQLELARSKDFYLVLDPAVPDLSLMLQGAELQRYAVLGIIVGRPRIAWIGRRDDRPWRGAIWSHGELEPARPVERIVVEEPTENKEGEEPSPPAIPPTAEERLPVPLRYLIRFADGLTVEVRPREADSAASGWTKARAWWSAKWRDVVAAMRRGTSDTLRLRIVLNPEDADSLYRALPPDVRLIVLDGGHD